MKHVVGLCLASWRSRSLLSTFIIWIPTFSVVHVAPRMSDNHYVWDFSPDSRAVSMDQRALFYTLGLLRPRRSRFGRTSRALPCKRWFGWVRLRILGLSSTSSTSTARWTCSSRGLSPLAAPLSRGRVWEEGSSRQWKRIR